MKIPKAYGAMALDLLVVPAFANVNLNPSSTDTRQGWEYGHTTVHVLRRDGHSDSLVASTNQPEVVESFPDVDRLVDILRSSKNVSQPHRLLKFIELANTVTPSLDR